MSMKWVHEGKVEVGEFCNAQGIIKQLGVTGVAMLTLLIAIYTFLGVWLGKAIKSIRVTWGLLMIVWSFIALMTILGNVINRDKGKSHYLSPVPYWCWISEDYLQWRIWGEYIWFWITLLSLSRYTFRFTFGVMVTFYSMNILSGNLLSKRRIWILNLRRRSMVMLAYPFVYCVITLPFSIIRWMSFVQEARSGVNHVSPPATFALGALFGLSGFCNVLLLLTTRPDSGLFCKPMQYTALSPLNGEKPSLHRMKVSMDGEDIGRSPSRSSA